MADMLEKARALRAKREQEAGPAQDEDGYQAMHTKPHPVLTLQIHTRDVVSVLEYSGLLETGFSTAGNEAVLSFQHLLMTIDGEGLLQLVEPLAEHKLARLVVFDAERHEEPAGDGAVVIRHVEMKPAGEELADEHQPDFPERPKH